MSFASWLNQAVLADLPANRRWSYLCFSISLCVALASHQFIGPVKTAIFMDLVGTDLEPVAKSLVLVVLVPVLISYSILVSLIASPGLLVAVVCGFYGVLYLVIAVVHAISGGHPGAWLAWVLYYATETKGVIIMPMIWSAIADVTTPDLAKKAYAIIFFAVQLGGIGGSFIAISVSDLGGEVGLILLQTGSFVIVAALAWLACALVASPEGEALVDAGSKPQVAASSGTGAAASSRAGQAIAVGREKLYEGFEGLWLLLSRPYVFMAFWVSYANLMPRTVLDYQNSVLGVARYDDNREAQIAFFGKVNMVINCGTAVLTLLGTRPIVEYLGVGSSLLVLPVGMLLCILALCLHYGLWMSTVSLVLVCILAYGLNSPCKEMLYVRTSRDIKYKAKSWSEMYGNQLMKLLGAQINLWVNRESDTCQPQCFHSFSTAMVSSTWVVVWMAVAARIGAQHRELEREDKIVS